MKSKTDCVPYHNGDGNSAQPSPQPLTTEEAAFLVEFQNGISKLHRSRPNQKQPGPRRVKIVLAQVNRVIVFRLRPCGEGSRKTCAGYELAILDPASGKAKRTWFYGTDEERWVRAGFETLIDAQARQVLDDRKSWRAYDALSWPTLPACIESLARPAALSLPRQGFVSGANMEVSP